MAAGFIYYSGSYSASKRQVQVGGKFLCVRSSVSIGLTPLQTNKVASILKFLKQVTKEASCGNVSHLLRYVTRDHDHM